MCIRDSPSPTGITIDPNSVNHIWTIDASTDRIYQYDAAVTRLTGTQEPSVTFALVAGNNNPQGIADPLDAGLPVTEMPLAPATVVSSLTTATDRSVIGSLLTAVGTGSDTIAAGPPIAPGRVSTGVLEVGPPMERAKQARVLEPIFIEISALQSANRIRHDLLDRSAARIDRRRPTGPEATGDDLPPSA